METVSKRPSYRAIGAALGLSHTMARKLHEKQGMPTDSIDSAKSWYALNGHHRATARGKSKVETPERSFQPESFQAPPALIPGNLPDQGTLNRMLTAAKVRVTELEAQQAKMDADLRDGKLLKADDVTRQVAGACIALKDRAMSIPTEYAVRLAAMTDPAEVAEVLRKALKGAIGDWFNSLRIEGGP